MENLSVDMSKSAMAQGSIASRFESQSTVDEARERKEEEWKAAYARLGQEPPKMAEEPVHDGRTLYEQLQQSQAAKDEEWETKLKLGNQFRGLHAEEFEFLSSEARKKQQVEQEWRSEEKKELAAYREQLAAKTAALESAASAAPNVPSAGGAAIGAGAIKPKAPIKPVKKDVRSLMKGIVVKKKPKVADTAKSVSVRKPASPSPAPSTAKGDSGKRAADAESDESEGQKKQKI